MEINSINQIPELDYFTNYDAEFSSSMVANANGPFTVLSIPTACIFDLGSLETHKFSQAGGMPSFFILLKSSCETSLSFFI